MEFLFGLGPWVAPLVLIAGFVPLIFGADKLVSGGSALALHFKIPPLVIGLTIVAFGTSAPELVVNLFAASTGNTSLALGNITGSNIFNILGILGISALIFPLAVKTSTTRIEVPLVLLSAVLMIVLANDVFINGSDGSGSSNMLTRVDGIIMLLFFVVFLYYMAHLMTSEPDTDMASEVQGGLGVSVFWIIFGLALLILGGKMIVDGAVQFSRDLGMSERIIGLTIVAVGTSLPELATSAVAAFRKNTDIAVGNIVGSNIFNVFFILGLTATLSPIPIKGPENVDMIINIGASILLLAFVYIGRQRSISRVEGGIFLAAYIGYVIFLLTS